MHSLITQIKGLFAHRKPNPPSSNYDSPQVIPVQNADHKTLQQRDRIASAWGENVPNDLFQAAVVYRKAADAGDADAQFKLGVLYLTGQGVFPDRDDSLTWIRRSAEQNNVRAQYFLATLYRGGSDDLPQNYGQALIWYRKAAARGYAPAQGDLGWLYATGQGVTQDYEQAVMWYLKAADQGESTAQYTLGMFYDSGLAGTQDYAQAAAWYRKAAENGHNTAQNNLGLLYALGQGVGQDFSQAYFWLDLGVRGREGAKREKAVESRDSVASQLEPSELNKVRQAVATWIAAHPAPGCSQEG